MIDVACDESFLPSQRRSMKLTAKGIQYVAEHFPGLLTSISEEEIADKSKAGRLANHLCVYMQSVSQRSA